jgi:hypothetical protein
MILCTANSRQSRDFETPNVADLIPSAMRETAANLIGFLEEYYRFLNTDGLPSHEIASITSEHDIDITSLKYLDAIQGEIAKGVPNSQVIDRVSLYKKIIRYYNTRGTEESAVVFFRIFFNELIEIFYPRKFLFIPSSGDWETTEYRDRRGFPSDQDKIRDSYYWQEFSYEIRSALGIGSWIDSYSKLVHPAGLKLFVALIIQLSRTNQWNEELDFFVEDPMTDHSWLTKLIPTWHTLSKEGEVQIGYHLPKYQPGWLANNYRIRRFFANAIYWAPDGMSNNVNYIRTVLLAINMLIGPQLLCRDALVRNEFQQSIKFFDCGSMSLCQDFTIEDAIEEYRADNTRKFLNISSITAVILDIDVIWINGSYDFDELGLVNEDWTMGSTEDEEPLVGDWVVGSGETIV